MIKTLGLLIIFTVLVLALSGLGIGVHISLPPIRFGWSMIWDFITVIGNIITLPYAVGNILPSPFSYAYNGVITIILMYVVYRIVKLVIEAIPF